MNNIISLKKSQNVEILKNERQNILFLNTIRAYFLKKIKREAYFTNNITREATFITKNEISPKTSKSPNRQPTTLFQITDLKFINKTPRDRALIKFNDGF